MNEANLAPNPAELGLDACRIAVRYDAEAGEEMSAVCCAEFALDERILVEVRRDEKGGGMAAVPAPALCGENE